MKAYLLNEAGGVENLVLSDIEKPSIIDGSWCAHLDAMGQ